MTTRKLIIWNRKGGVGKSTIAVNTAAGFAQLGYTTLLIDTDPQGSASLSIGIPPDDGFYELMCQPHARIGDWVRTADPNRYAANPETESNLFVISSSTMTARVPLDNPSPFRFRRLCREISELFEQINRPLDFIIVDTQPSDSMLDGAIMLAADAVVIPTQCAELSFKGVERAIEQLSEINDEHEEFRTEPIKLAGIVPNMFRQRTLNHRDFLRKLVTNFGADNILYPLPLTTDIESCSTHHISIYAYIAPGEPVVMSFWRLCAEIGMKLGLQPAAQSEQTIQAIEESVNG
jgi:chromosome partitioning protein